MRRRFNSKLRVLRQAEASPIAVHPEGIVPFYGIRVKNFFADLISREKTPQTMWFAGLLCGFHPPRTAFFR
jgi:hypothetical protein